MFRSGGNGGLGEDGKGDLGARASLAERVQCSPRVAEGGGGQSAFHSHLSRSPDSVRRRPGLGVGPAARGGEGKLGGSRALGAAAQ